MKRARKAIAELQRQLKIIERDYQAGEATRIVKKSQPYGSWIDVIQKSHIQNLEKAIKSAPCCCYGDITYTASTDCFLMGLEVEIRICRGWEDLFPKTWLRFDTFIHYPSYGEHHLGLQVDKAISQINKYCDKINKKWKKVKPEQVL